MCVAACQIARDIFAGGVLVNGLVGAGQSFWDYSGSAGSHSVEGYAEAGPEGAVDGAIPWDQILKSIAGGSDG